jgi:serine/threonine protein kinase/tetratricopeptide (TPR) repeat protein
MTPGKHITHYEIAGKLGEGGMGVVFKAWDHKLGRFVALKFLPAHLSESESQVARFRQEARAISALNHPNIATIYAIDEADGQYFLALEYLPGGTLKGALDQLRTAGQFLSFEQGLEHAIQIAEALAHAHKHGVIHRDIKSANVLFTEAGTLKITDFGLAKLDEGATVTQAGSVLGTPATMSPEQAQGFEVDERSDIFSAGVVMFEMFAGQLPFKGTNSAAVLYQVVHSPTPELGQFRSGIPIAIQRIITKALEKDRAMRYQAAADLAADLRTVRRELELGSSSAGRSSLETVAIGVAPVRRRRGKALQIAAACVTFGMMAWLAWPSLRERVSSSSSWLHARSLPVEKRLAVLPFRNFGGDPKDQAFVDGLREVVIGKLTRLERPGGSLVVVVSPDEVRNKEINVAADAWKRLGANLVMTGSVIRAGQQPQVIVNLEDPQNLTVLRSETIDASKSDLMTEANRLVRMLELEMSSGTRNAVQAGDSRKPDAMRYYIEGRGYLLRYDRAENLDLAAGAFRDAVAKDSNYALAWAGLAETLWQKYKVQKESGLLTEAADDSAHAIQLNSRLAEVHTTMGQIRLTQGNHESAVQEIQAALALEPANATAYRDLGAAYEAMRKYGEAERTYQKAIETRPGDAAGYIYLGSFYIGRERLPDAERNFRRATELAPDSYLAHSNLGGLYIRMARYTEAVDQLEKSVSIAPSARGYGNLGAAYYYLKRYADAVAPYQRAVELAPGNSANWGNLADAYRWTPALSDQAPAAFRHAIELLTQEMRTVLGDPRLHARLAMYRVSIGDRRRALTEIAEALRLDPSLPYVLYRAALVYEQAGDRDRALEHMELALKAGQPLADILAAPPLEQLRKDPRFVRMAGRLP